MRGRHRNVTKNKRRHLAFAFTASAKKGNTLLQLLLLLSFTRGLIVRQFPFPFRVCVWLCFHFLAESKVFFFIHFLFAFFAAASSVWCFLSFLLLLLLFFVSNLHSLLLCNFLMRHQEGEYAQWGAEISTFLSGCVIKIENNKHK